MLQTFQIAFPSIWSPERKEGRKEEEEQEGEILSGVRSISWTLPINICFLLAAERKGKSKTASSAFIIGRNLPTDASSFLPRELMPLYQNYIAKFYAIFIKWNLHRLFIGGNPLKDILSKFTVCRLI